MSQLAWSSVELAMPIGPRRRARGPGPVERVLLENIDPHHRGTKRTLQVVGPVVLVAGILLSVVGFADFTSGFGANALEDESPLTGFWLIFIGFPLINVGWTICKVAFLGEIARYGAAEIASPARETLRYVGLGKTEVTCITCGAANDPGSRFCDNCGRALTTVCPSCRHENEPGSNFCDACGQALVAPTTPAPRSDDDPRA